jgi:hypothetical protein
MAPRPIRDQFEINGTYTAGKQPSDYWNLKMKTMEVPQAIVNNNRQLFNALDTIDTSRRSSGQIMNLYGHLKYGTEMLKEYVFEDIRQNKFNGNPSRKTCLFCFDTTLDPKEYVEKMGIAVNERFLLEIEAIASKSIYLRTRPSKLNCNLSVIEDIEKRAVEYWRGSDVVDFDTEILLNGEFKIIKLIE